SAGGSFPRRALRKSRNQRFNGYKRHVLKDLDLGMVRAVGVTSANQPQAEVTQAIEIDLKNQKVKLKELQIDRAYLTSHLVKERDSDLTIVCKSWRVQNGKLFDKTSFILDWENAKILCPNGISLPLDISEKCQYRSKTRFQQAISRRLDARRIANFKS
ncbi:MAG: hypothetical protein ACREPR_09855, partial [Brasilonema sp.]